MLRRPPNKSPAVGVLAAGPIKSWLRERPSGDVALAAIMNYRSTWIGCNLGVGF
jgi:hypothetical protein